MEEVRCCANCIGVVTIQGGKFSCVHDIGVERSVMSGLLFKRNECTAFISKAEVFLEQKIMEKAW